MEKRELVIIGAGPAGLSAASYGKRCPEGIRIELKLSQQELANLVGTSRESVNKQLRTWEDKGWIRLDRGMLLVRRPAALEDLAGESDG